MEEVRGGGVRCGGGPSWRRCGGGGAAGDAGVEEVRGGGGTAGVEGRAADERLGRRRRRGEGGVGRPGAERSEERRVGKECRR